ncbi:MAG: hypothetical protein PHU65_08370 [Actinomycetota bacterium]|nr:hypothetical protein [Actinomycetota bacterium]
MKGKSELKGINIVFQRDIKELLKTSIFKIVSIIFALVTVAASLILVFVLRKQDIFSNEYSKSILELIIGLISYFIPLTILMTFIWSFANFMVINEKARGNIESLLATPLDPKDISKGKSFAVFLPAYIISSFSYLIILLSLNFAVIFPKTGEFLFPPQALLIGFIINPIFFMGLLFIIVVFSLAANPDIAIAPSFIVGFGLMLGIPLGLATGNISILSWSFVLWCLAGAALIWIILIFSFRLLSKEKIILSSRGA